MSSTRIHVTPSSAGLYDAAGAASTAEAAAIAASQGAWNVITKTSAYTAVAWDYILADTTDGTFAVTVPSPTAGKQWGIKWLAGSVAPTFVGFTSPPTLSALNQGMEFVGDGTVWRQINRPALAQLPDYPTLTDARYIQLQEAVNTQSSISGTYTLPDVTTATNHRVTLTGNTTLVFPTAGAGKNFTVVIVQDGSGSRTLTWPTVKWPSGVVPTVSSGANKIDVYTFSCFDGTNWLGWTAGQAMA